MEIIELKLECRTEDFANTVEQVCSGTLIDINREMKPDYDALSVSRMGKVVIVRVRERSEQDVRKDAGVVESIKGIFGINPYSDWVVRIQVTPLSLSI